MTDRAVKQTAVKGGASTVDMAARPFQCEWHEGCSKVCASSDWANLDVEAPLRKHMLIKVLGCRASIESLTSNVIIGYIPTNALTLATISLATRLSYSAVR